MRPGLVVILLILAVAAPGVAAYSYYLITDDPYGQPLGITQERLAGKAKVEERIEVVARVTWPGPDADAAAQARLGHELQAAFRSFGIVAHVEFGSAAAGAQGSVVYEVGASRLGPFMLGNAAAGVRPAVEAYRLSQGR
ncbi:hypothetical protein DDZ14_17670 [Maritimibacter sp. 55A14]|uniref:hypothetical protein n=1 Tax=Maritimibacter sp. 55A14 TaxID=2174844 RepID=UPI000D622795|nr:hypothetical protein [Maritimibacter sp. 55A14]PWE29336.1 hypothetical protein DDZ14_17670 [Maritimibacter sp. 55A14]